MMLIVILNGALAIAIVGVIVALHSHAIVRDHRHHNGQAKLWTWRARPTGATAAVRPATAGPADRRTPRRQPAAAWD